MIFDKHGKLVAGKTGMVTRVETFFSKKLLVRCRQQVAGSQTIER
jgi:hypothetical protein